VTDQDQQIAGFSHEEGRALILAVNKWDLFEARLLQELQTPELTPAQRRTLIADFTQDARRRLVFADYAPLVFVSALLRQGLPELMQAVLDAGDQHSLRLATPELNRLITDATSARTLSFRGKQLKIYYATQPRVRPPTFILFVNNPQYAHFSHRRYLENEIRRRYRLEGTPLRLIFREAKGDRQTTERSR
jgi:GTP-binding protein